MGFDDYGVRVGLGWCDVFVGEIFLLLCQFLIVQRVDRCFYVVVINCSVSVLRVLFNLGFRIDCSKVLLFDNSWGRNL